MVLPSLIYLYLYYIILYYFKELYNSKGISRKIRIHYYTITINKPPIPGTLHGSMSFHFVWSKKMKKLYLFHFPLHGEAESSLPSEKRNPTVRKSHTAHLPPHLHLHTHARTHAPTHPHARTIPGAQRRSLPERENVRSSGTLAMRRYSLRPTRLTITMPIGCN